MSNDPDGPNTNPENCDHYFMQKNKWGWHCPSCGTDFDGEE